jgi:hypothetical protein
MKAKLLFSCSMILLLATAYAFVADYDQTSGAGAGHNQGTGSLWQGPANITALDTSYAIADPIAETRKLKATYFTAFNIPTGATIKGIEATYYGTDYCALYNWDESTFSKVQLLKYADPVGDIETWGAPLFQCDELWYHSFGGALSLWGTTWTPAQINADGFGVQVWAHYLPGVLEPENSFSVKVDYVTLKVCYSTNEGPLMSQSATSDRVVI